MSVIHSRSVARKIARRRAGLGFLDRRRRSPEERVTGMQDPALRSTVRFPEERLVLATQKLPSLEPQPRRVIHDRTHGLATRVPPLKNMKTARGWTYHRNVIVYHESELEHRVSLRLQVRNDVAAVHSQFPVLQHLDDDGKLHQHTADLFVVYDDGSRQAIIIKHEHKREEMEALIKRIKAHPSSQQVDDIVLRTELYGTIEAAENAHMIRWSREYHDQADVDELMGVVGTLHGWFRFGSLLKDCPSIERRRVAIWRLIDTGFLFSVTGEKITELTWLGHASAGGATGLLG
ncbi:hypothetical protein [Rhizobium leguminosarum]|uniref:hypothetical protein n=1 Tax=Rhizobium leguminosarum TaxID=384 RepID=UPI0012F7AA62|nr:hypothetical protein [Rhizobium leguminosarum]MVO94436.1 hypothetical protein [Rhizobium leguminosarum bv. phaseoli]